MGSALFILAIVALAAFLGFTPQGAAVRQSVAARVAGARTVYALERAIGAASQSASLKAAAYLLTGK